MTIPERVIWITAVAGLLIAVERGGAAAPRSTAANRPRSTPGVRISMDALHQQGGVPMGWQVSLPPGAATAGRQAFVDFGCPACHRVAGEPFASADSNDRGPELSGMGSHHPATYFAEAILNPDAVLIDAPDYVTADGHSRMPAYPDMTLAQLSDLVAYLASLQQGGSPSCHSAAATGAVSISTIDLHDRPRPAADAGRRFFVQSYDVLPGQLAQLEAWLHSEGREHILAADGVLGFETFVDLSRSNGKLTSVVEFRDEAALRNFIGDPATAEWWQQFDRFVGPHGHLTTDRPVVYSAPSLSIARDAHEPAM